MYRTIKRDDPTPTQRYEAMEVLSKALKELDDLTDEIMNRYEIKKAFSTSRNRLIREKIMEVMASPYSLRAELIGRMALMKEKYKIGEPQVQNISRMDPRFAPPLHHNCRSHVTFYTKQEDVERDFGSKFTLANPYCPNWKDRGHRGCDVCDAYYTLKNAVKEKTVERMAKELFNDETVTIKVPARLLKKTKKKATKKKPTKRKKYAKK